MRPAILSGYRWLHVLFLCLTICFIVLFGLVQSVTDTSGRALTVQSLFLGSTWKRIATSIRDRKGLTSSLYYVQKENNVYEVNGKNETDLGTLPAPISNHTIVVFPSSHAVSYISEISQVCVLMQQKASFCTSFEVDRPSHIEIVHWNANGKELYIATRNTTWTLWSLDVTSQKKMLLVKDIHFPQDVLTRSYEPILDNIMYPTCNQHTCWFEHYDLQKHMVTGTVPAIRDEHQDEKLSILHMEFFSSQDHLLAYDQLNAEGVPFRFFTIQYNTEGNDAKPLLLQSVRLDANPELPLTFIHYFSANRYLLFKGIHSENGKQELFAYSAIKPSLRLLGIFPNEAIIRPLNTTDMFGYNRTGNFGYENVLRSITRSINNNGYEGTLLEAR